MPVTPDRHPGPFEENEEIRLTPNASGPSQAGAFNYNGTRFVFRDADGNFNPLDQDDHKTLRQLIHLAEEGGPFEGFASGAYQETLPAADPFPTSITWWTSAAKTHRIVRETITYNANRTIDTDQWEVFDTDGSTVLATVTDAIAYSGVFETSRTRTIA